MTGKEIVQYIISNDLLDKEFITNDIFPGYHHYLTAAAKYHVGPVTIKTWVAEGLIEGIFIGDELYIRADVPDPRTKGKNDEKDSKNSYSSESNVNVYGTTIVCRSGTRDAQNTICESNSNIKSNTRPRGTCCGKCKQTCLFNV